MLLLIYAAVLDFFGIVFSIYPLVRMVIEIARGDYSHLWHFIFGLVGFLLALIFAYIIFQFLKYHFDLIDKNMTTIEHLDEKRGNIRDYNYDMGKEWNFNFVFGKVKACWFFPYNKGDAASTGDGTVFLKTGNNQKVMEEGDSDIYNDNFDNDNWSQQ